jgi:hypothetical protein
MHRIMPLPFKPPRLDGLSERLLASHYENNYGGAVRRLNAIESRLSEINWDAAPVFDLNGLKREELIAYMASRSAAMPSLTSVIGASTRASSPAASLPGIRLARRPSRWRSPKGDK